MKDIKHQYEKKHMIYVLCSSILQYGKHHIPQLARNGLREGNKKHAELNVSSLVPPWHFLKWTFLDVLVDFQVNPLRIHSLDGQEGRVLFKRVFRKF